MSFLEDKLQEIANAIRNAEGSVGPIQPDDFASRISEGGLHDVSVYTLNADKEGRHNDGTWNTCSPNGQWLNTAMIDTFSNGFVAEKSGNYNLFFACGVQVTDGSAEYEARIINVRTGDVYASMEQFFLLYASGLLGMNTRKYLTKGDEIRFQFRRRETSGNAIILKGTTAGIAEV